MKIVTQLPSATTKADTKATPVLDDSSSFQGALTTATAKSTDGAGMVRGSDKSQASENKKKNIVSNNPAVESAIPLLPASNPSSQHEDTPIAIAQAINDSVLSQATGEPSDSGRAGAGFPTQSGASSSFLASIPPTVELPVNVHCIDAGDSKMLSSGLELAATSSKPSDPTSTDITQQSDISVGIAQTHKSTAAIPSPVPQSALEPASPEAARASQNRRGPGGTEIFSADKTVDAPGPSTSAVEAASVLAQSVAAPVLLPSLSSAPAPQPRATLAIGKSPDGNTFSGIAKEAPSRQIAPVAKGKSTTSEARDGVADDRDGDAQAAGAPQASASSAKILDVTGTGNHASSDARSSFDATALQQPMQSTSSGSENNNSQSSQSANAKADPVIQNTSVHAASDSQTMQGLTSAQLTQSMRSSEMKLGMQSAEFGNISISTSLNHQAISAQISIDHSELGKAIAVHLPAIQEKLGSAYGVQAKVELRESTNPSPSNDSGYSNSGQQSRNQRQSGRDVSTVAHGTMFERDAHRSSLTASPAAASAARLDIRI